MVESMFPVGIRIEACSYQNDINFYTVGRVNFVRKKFVYFTVGIKS